MDSGGLIVAIVLSLGAIAFLLHMLIEQKAMEDYLNNDDDD